MSKAKQGNPSAQDQLGLLYTRSCIAGSSETKAIKWYKRAAKQKNTDALYTLGASYLYGTMGVKDYVQSYIWFNILKTVDPASITPINKLEALMTSKEIETAQRMSDQIYSTFK